MIPSEAKEILLLYRPGTPDEADAQVVEALECARRDPELARWLEKHQAFQAAVQTKLRQIEVPQHFKDALLARQKTIPAPTAWRTPVWLAAAAAVALLLGWAAFWQKPPVPDRFHNFRDTMVSIAIRQYRMDLVTNDMRQLRQFVAARGAPADYQVPQGLEMLELTGGAALSWRTNPVAMVCFKQKGTSMLYLFAMKRGVLKDPPPEQPKVTKVSELLTASWTKGDLAYVLAGPDEPDFASKYLPTGGL
jgi:hypothetical protein